MVNFLDPYRSRLSAVRVDAIGMGHNFGLHLRDQEFCVELINVRQPCESKPQADRMDPAQRFVNQKAHFYQILADAFERDLIEGLTDDVTVGQLANLLYEYDSHGRMKIEPKERARARGVTSPDRAEALMLALGKPSESPFPLWMLQDMAVSLKRNGKPVDEIAQQLDATPDEVRDWIQHSAPLVSSPYRKLCDVCGSSIEDNIPYEQTGGRYRHVRCPEK